MRAFGACVGFLLLSTALVLGQGYGSIPGDALIVGFGEPGSGYEALEAGSPGGRFVTALMIATNTWNPVVASDAGSRLCTGEMQRGLIGIHPVTGAYYPELAKSWTISEDGLTVTLRLREGIRWSDGEPFTADDVVFTYNDLILNDDVNAADRDSLLLPDGTYPVIEQLDASTVRVTLSVAFRPVLDALRTRIAPEHVLAEFVHKRNPEVPTGTFNATWSLDTPEHEVVGLGPFVLAEYVADEYVRMERNPYYYHYDVGGTQLPYVDELTILFVASRDVALLKFLNGEIHSIDADVSDTGILFAEAAPRGYTVRVGEEGYGHSFVMFNQDAGDNRLRELFRNLSFRQAIAHASDKEGHLNRVLGLADILWSPISMASPYYAGREYYGGPITEANAVLYEYDLGKAVELLDECSVVDRDGDGIREFEDGTPVEFELATVTGYEFAEQSMLALTDDLRRVGIRVHLNLLNFQYLAALLFGGQWQAIAIGLTGGHDPHGSASVLRSTGSLHMWHYSAGFGDTFPYEQEIDRLLDQAAGIYDPDEAFELYKQIQLIFAREDLGMIFGLQPRELIAVYDCIGNGTAIRSKGTPYGTVFDILFFRDEA
jgi:peptide/nickel transport system substrate-binding protein